MLKEKLSSCCEGTSQLVRAVSGSSPRGENSGPETLASRPRRSWQLSVQMGSLVVFTVAHKGTVGCKQVPLMWSPIPAIHEKCSPLASSSAPSTDCQTAGVGLAGVSPPGGELPPVFLLAWQALPEGVGQLGLLWSGFPHKRHTMGLCKASMAKLEAGAGFSDTDLQSEMCLDAWNTSSG